MRLENYLTFSTALLWERHSATNSNNSNNCYKQLNQRKLLLSKKPLLAVAFLLILLAQPLLTDACELKFNISGEKKEVYKVGAEVIVEVEIVYTHRTCEIQLSDTKFTYEGMKILGATAWKEKAPNTFSRQIKLMLLDDSLTEAKLSIVRKCSKEGAIGSFKISKSK